MAGLNFGASALQSRREASSAASVQLLLAIAICRVLLFLAIAERLEERKTKHRKVNQSYRVSEDVGLSLHPLLILSLH